MLSTEDIQAKMMSIIKTFVNSLVIKSTEPWATSLDLATLLEQYKHDKDLIGGKATCNCKNNENCKKPHTNLYETAFCELRSYAMVHVKDNIYKYDITTHNKIMELVEQVFNNSSILVEWNIYIEKLIADIKMGKSTEGGVRLVKQTKVKGGRFLRKTRRATRISSV